MRLALAVLAAAACLALAAPASAADMADCSKKLERTYKRAYKKVDRRFKVNAEGRNILKRGVRWRGVTFYATCHDLRRVRRDLLNLLEPTAYPALLVRTAARPRLPLGDVMQPSHAAGSTLSRIAECESHGDPTAESDNGLYKGKYQFDQGTWESVGGVGRPHHASEYEQDYRAARLYTQSGPSPWPICGYV